MRGRERREEENEMRGLCIKLWKGVVYEMRGYGMAFWLGGGGIHWVFHERSIR
jgi:hypothetical protein